MKGNAGTEKQAGAEGGQGAEGGGHAEANKTLFTETRQKQKRTALKTAGGNERAMPAQRNRPGGEAGQARGGDKKSPRPYLLK
jgi:hypothetical protein